MISNILTKKAIVEPYSCKVWEYLVQPPFLERALRATREQSAALFNPVRRATQISITTLDEQVITDNLDLGLDPCAVCLEEFLVGSRVTSIPRRANSIQYEA